MKDFIHILKEMLLAYILSVITILIILGIYKNIKTHFLGLLIGSILFWLIMLILWTFERFLLKK